MSWGEIMVIGGVALVVIGPKDLPKALRTVGQMTTKVRRLAGEFHAQFNEAMREADLQDVKKEVDGLNRTVAAATSATFNPIQTIRDELKASVEGRSSSAAPTAAVAAAELPAIVSPDPISAEPIAPPAEIYGLNPETAPLVPMPEPATTPLAHEPVVSSGTGSGEPDPARIVTGPGLEPVAEPEMPREARA